MPKGVLFDLDGTLLDSAPDFVVSLDNLLEKHNQPKLDPEIIRSHVSDGSWKLVSLGFNIDVSDKKCAELREELSGGQRQAIAIARATAFNSKLVIMDEPTAALAIKEVGKVLDLINGLKKIGVSVIIISHRMDDIFAVCDRVTALFQGTNFAEAELSKTSRDEVIGWIMGKK